MKLAILAKRDYNDSKVIYDVLVNEFNRYMDELYVDIKNMSEAERIAKDLALYLGIKVREVPRSTSAADATIIIYTDGKYEVYHSQEPYEEQIDRELSKIPVFA
jgi:hypothetical protein